MADERARDSWCFACGPDNPIGLHIAFKINSDNIYAEFVPERVHQGYDGVVHGGIIATLLDEAMANLLYLKGLDCTTGKMEVRYRQPARVGSKIKILGQILEKRSKYAKTRAILFKSQQNNQISEVNEQAESLSLLDLSTRSDLIIAEATAIFMIGARPS
ncbi:MAG: PaaI family thioesterase [Candidatus Tectomicrobia bacterium]|uniref:Acyl-coenzyme A thioesterase THEM4 n=1 Tax=Tectimicrobiota bacterium TaxID=2528274 RepID=A0A933LQV4_UNCTE|nr:PaaI family thioesterase [Candidatus Tectomicrobia bacterium]